jgi:D-serine deaminase-like pyridoxal phosphate-dependent protein
MLISDLDTPSLVIDLDVMERNLRNAAVYARQKNLRLRPHTKTHKIPELGRMQLHLGAAGLTVAKVSEAEVMMEADPPELLIAYPVVSTQKASRLAGIAQQVAVTVSLDSIEAAKQVSVAAKTAGVEIGVLGEMDAGMQRVGVDPGAELSDLARNVMSLPGLRFKGIAFFAGHVHPLVDGGLAQLERLASTVRNAVQTLDRAGIPVQIVSGGSTPSLFFSHQIPYLNEVRPGTYIFNDRNTVLSGACGYEECAATIITTVISTARHGQVIIDAGSKTLSSDPPAVPDFVGFGHVVDMPEAVIRALNEEHGYVDVHKVGRRLAVGERLQVVPNHICVAVNLQNEVYGVRNGVVEQIWNVKARGKLH